MPNIIGTDSSGTSLLATVYFNYERQLERSTASDIVVERDLIGTTRTVINRIGFGSNEFTRQLWGTSQAIDNLNSMRGRTVTVDGETYDITFTSNIIDILDSKGNVKISRVSVRFKEVSS